MMKRSKHYAFALWHWRAAVFAGAALAQQINIAIATGGTGGVYYPLGGGMANVLSKYVPGVQATARVTGGSVDNLKLIGSQQSEVALVMVDAALDALKGEDKFKGSPVDVRTLMVLYPEPHARRVDRRHGHREDGRPQGQARLHRLARQRHRGDGVPRDRGGGPRQDKDMRRERLGVAESVNALKDGKIDAFFWVGGLPTAAVTDLGATPGVKIKMIDHAEVVDEMNEKYGDLYTTGVIPAKTYPGQDKDNAITVVQNILVPTPRCRTRSPTTSSRPSSRSATSLSLHAEAKHCAGESVDKNSTIPWHPGAMKYFKEKGLTF